jgi:multicomponent K+:H+ antiporter subunit A
MFSVAYSLRFIHGVFFGPAPQGLPRTPHEPPRWMRFPIELLVLACLAVGILPALTVGPLLDIAVRALLGPQAPAYSLAVWHGFSRPVVMSLIALAGGTLLYVLLQKPLARGDDETPLLPRIDGRRIFDAVLVAVSRRWPAALVRLAGTERLQPQLRLAVVAALLAGLWPAWQHGLAFGPLPASPVDPALALAWVVGVACALGAAGYAKFHRLVALLLAGGTGLVVCLTFVWMSAPDLALTQLVVEVVTTVLLLLGLRWLPKRVPAGTTAARTAAGARAAAPRRARDLALAIASGGGLAALSYAVMTRPLPETVSHFFMERAYPEGGGGNVVNVIIVDFRGFDTLGEISVLAVVALSVYALLRRFRPARESLAPRSGRRETNAEDLLVPGVIARLMFPVIAMLAVYLLLRGHNLPGGGFAAGVTLAVAVILQYLAGGTRWTESRLAIRPARWIGAGLLLAGATGAGSWLFARPFLTSHTAHVTLPVLGELHLPSAFLFDLGVFSLVVGATGLILIALAHQSVRSSWS